MLRVRAAGFWPMVLCVSVLPVQAQTIQAQTIQARAVQAQTSGDHGIVIVTGEFGTLGDRRKLEMAPRLQQLCGSKGDSCEAGP